MLEDIHVLGVGGIREASLSLDGAFIVITGESGSGKSSLVRAMEFIAGKRAHSGLIHVLEESADVAVTLAADEARELPDEYRPQEGTLVVRRTFSKNGRGRCSLQNIPLPLNALSSAMENRLVIQSQFAQLSLLDPAKQLDLVDSCGGTPLERIKVNLEKVFNETLSAEREIIDLKKRREETETFCQGAEETLLKVRALEIKEDSEDRWEKEIRDLESKEIIRESLSVILERLTGGAAGGGLSGELEAVAHDIYEIFADRDKQWKKTVEEALLGLQSLSKLLKDELTAFPSDENAESTKERLEKKIGSSRKLRRTHDLHSCKELIEYAERAESGMKWLLESRTELEELEKAAAAKRKETKSLALELRRMRREAAKELALRVNCHLADLAMENVLFSIEVEDLEKLRVNGAEAVTFMLSQPDQPPLPVGRNASGGELSRILIALQLSLGDEKLPGTLVFDEVEAGLGGRTALLAGYKLRELSRRCRTLLITHEAVIASMADQHFLVKREGDETYIHEVSGGAREKEIARMLAGDEDSREALEHARSLLADGGE